MLLSLLRGASQVYRSIANYRKRLARRGQDRADARVRGPCRRAWLGCRQAGGHQPYQLPERLAEAKSYAERLFVFPDLGALSETAARRAIVRPAEVAIPDRPVRYEDPAVDAILELSERYPYFLQAYGLQIWNAAPEGDLIAIRDVKKAAAPAREELDRDFFETRFARATNAGRKYLAAMAKLGDGPYASGEVAERGRWRTVMSAGPVRQTLIDKGLIYSPDHGQVDFTAPHFGDFMRRKHPL